MRLVIRNEREGVYRSTRKKFGMVGISMTLIVVMISWIYIYVHM